MYFCLVHLNTFKWHSEEEDLQWMRIHDLAGWSPRVETGLAQQLKPAQLSTMYYSVPSSTTYTVQ